jgi:hypothetical protein
MSSSVVSMTARRPETSFHCALLVLCAVVLLLAWVLGVRGGTSVVLPGIGLAIPDLCMTRRLLGIDCPGCGMTRCFISLAHGDLASAWTFNPAGFWLFAMMAFQLPYRTLQLWRIRLGKPELALHRVATWSLAVFSALLVAQWAGRFLTATN